MGKIKKCFLVLVVFFGVSLSQAEATVITDHYAVTLNDSVLFGDSSNGSFTFNLPTAVGIANKEFSFKKIDASANLITIDPAGNETIDSGLMTGLSFENDAITIISDGSNWKITAQPFHLYANSNDLWLQLEKHGARTWEIGYGLSTFNSTAPRNYLELSSTLDPSMDLRIDEYGMIHVGDLNAAFPDIYFHPSLGPAVRIAGDFTAGDYIYFGSYDPDGWASLAIGVRAPGAVPANTGIFSGEVTNQDNIGGAFIILHPDSALPGVGDRGALDLVAYGQPGVNDGDNTIHFRARANSNGDLKDLMKLDGKKGGNPVYLLVNGTLKQVTPGPPNSGGQGYRILRVAN